MRLSGRHAHAANRGFHDSTGCAAWRLMPLALRRRWMCRVPDSPTPAARDGCGVLPTHCARPPHRRSPLEQAVGAGAAAAMLSVCQVHHLDPGNALRKDAWLAATPLAVREGAGVMVRDAGMWWGGARPGPDEGHQELAHVPHPRREGAGPPRPAPFASVASGVMLPEVDSQR